jgi:hypothetical protein
VVKGYLASIIGFESISDRANLVTTSAKGSQMLAEV